MYQISALFFIFLVMKSIKFRVNHIIRNFHFIVIFALIAASYFQKDYDLTLIYALVVGTLLFKNYYISIENLKKYIDLVLIIIFIIAIIELVLGNTYHQFLDIFSYYLNSRSRYSPTELEIYTQIGAYRGESNYILPFINYRVSSIFLEPLGLAYFSIICLGFYRSLDAHSNTLIEMKNNYWRYILIISLIILSDTRSSYLIFIVIFLIPKNLMALKNSYIAIILTIMSFIILVWSTAEIDSEFYRRIYPTIYSLTNLKTIFNLSKYNFGILDSGYGGIMANLGILGFMYIFSFLMNSNNSLDKKKSSIYFFNFTVLYLFYFAIFGGAIFSIKTFVLLIILYNSICFDSHKLKE